VADAGPDQTAQSNDIVQLDGGGSTDVDGDSLIYSWSLVTMPDGSSVLLSDPTAVDPSFIVDTPGTYVAQLIVNDGAVDSAPDTVTINWENSAPVADAGPDQTAIVDESVTFDGSGSYDIDDGIKAYVWHFGDGTTASGEAATHVYANNGIYTVTLTVTDNSDEIDTDTAQVAVVEQSALVMYVESIEMELSTKNAGKNEFTKALTIVTIFDGESPVNGAAVYGSWSGATSDSDYGVTDTNGKVTLESDSIKNPSAATTFNFKVDDVVKSIWAYVPSSNKETTDSVTTP
jgi:PKD repeat protein